MKRFLVVLVLSLCVTGVALADDMAAPTAKKGTWDFYGGAGFSKLTESGSPGGSIGAQVGANYQISPQFALGAMSGYYVLGKPAVATTGDKAPTLSVIPVTAQASYMVKTESTFKPYLGAGAGMYNSRASSSTVSGVDVPSVSSSKFGFNFGAGFEVQSSSMAYGLDAKFHVIRNGDDTAGTSSTKLVSAMATLHFH